MADRDLHELLDGAVEECEDVADEPQVYTVEQMAKMNAERAVRIG